MLANIYHRTYFQRKLLVKKLLIATTLCLFSANSAMAFTYGESSDTGELIPTATVIDLSNVTSSPSDPSLTSITGNITSNDADLFGIFLTAGQLFSATTVVTTAPPVAYDSQLFLFDAQGFGIVANDNLLNVTTLSSITFTATTTGIYYLGISGFNYDPRDTAGNFIFADTRTGQIAPNAGVAALGSWANNTGSTSTAFSYNIAMIGALPVPEPAVGGGLLAFAGLGVTSAFRRKRQLNP